MAPKSKTPLASTPEAAQEVIRQEFKTSKVLWTEMTSGFPSVRTCCICDHDMPSSLDRIQSKRGKEERRRILHRACDYRVCLRAADRIDPLVLHPRSPTLPPVLMDVTCPVCEAPLDWGDGDLISRRAMMNYRLRRVFAVNRLCPVRTVEEN
ncbi:uncharacterized protein EI97DRAFT_443758 [Westerdykella ornata]|uniref:Uncharacterized protein n=1 Tax=Westerdykella ornata TaxID=318751 RepID=A0A6A6JEA5_WESOR|nr:uncharacterized protein EI97DRAFT_443758 [Westerdykella ornata]KAF2274891.1 hypothetical protein EI97DRAFT_443758 [Westerdykella ornata]